MSLKITDLANSIQPLHGGIINELWKCSKNDTDCEAIVVKIQGFKKQLNKLLLKVAQP